jgi:hypothetical protein
MRIPKNLVTIKRKVDSARRRHALHGILVTLPSGIMFGLFWAVKQFHGYCRIFS